MKVRKAQIKSQIIDSVINEDDEDNEEDNANSEDDAEINGESQSKALNDILLEESLITTDESLKKLLVSSCYQKTNNFASADKKELASL